MKIVVESALYLVFVVVSVLLAYQVVLGIAAAYIKQKKNVVAQKYRKFAVVIPAHNEEKMIAKTIYSFMNIDYPQKLFDIIVIADNCNDNTAQIASELGAQVLVRFDDTKKGKGYALRWGFDQIVTSDSQYDAVVVIDSDSLVSGNYLNVLNYYLEQGSRVIQSSDLVLPQPDNWSIEATRIGFLLFNYIKPLGRKYLGFHAGLRGNGMCFSTDVLRETPWQAWSLTEDVEYGLILILNGYQIDFAPEATVWAQMPVHSANAESQRTRWEHGRYQITKQYAPKFLKLAITNRSLVYFDLFIDLITPPFVNLMLFVSMMMVLTFMLMLLSITGSIHFGLWFLMLLLGIFYLFYGLRTAGADSTLYKSLLYIPRYIFWKIKVWLRSAITRRELNWIRTTRDN